MEQTGDQAEVSVRTILPVLKTFPTNEIAIIGCHALNIARRSCEYDLLVVSPDPIPEKLIKVGDVSARLIFRNEADVRQPDPELALTLASAIPLRDSSFLLAGAALDCRRAFVANSKRSMEMHLASSLKSLARVDELLSEKETREADLSLLSAARDFAYAELLTNGRVPCPSHLLGQMKALPKRRPSSFKPWADAFGLELSSRVTCENRLEGLSVIYDAVRTSGVGAGAAPYFGRYREVEAFKVMETKAKELLEMMQSAECFAYLGQEAVQSLFDLYLMHVSKLRKERDYSRVVRDLTVGSDRLISEEVVKSLGLVRSQEMIGSAATGLKSAVSSLAKRI